MRQRQPPQLDMRAIFSAAHDAIDSGTDAPRWHEILVSSFGRSEWHEPPAADAVWYWHASGLSQCTREQILKRAKLATDGIRVESRNVFEIGHLYHALAQFGMEQLQQYEDIRTEIGGQHPVIPLAARADIVYRYQGEWVIFENKTESEFAGKHRREERDENGSSARHEHQVQVTAQAMVLEQELGRIDFAYVAYIGKESGNVDQQPVLITDALRTEVEARVNKLEVAWFDWALSGILPPMLPDEQKTGRDRKPYMAPAWQCRARGDDDPKGLYCQARSTCFQLKGEGR